MSTRKVYKYCHVECTNEPPSERTDNDIHSEMITLYDTDRERLEKVAIIHNEQHFGGEVEGICDTYPYHEKLCPCNGGKPPVRVWNGEEVGLIPYDRWAEHPDVPVLYLNDPKNQGFSSKTNIFGSVNRFVRTIFKKVGIL